MYPGETSISAQALKSYLGILLTPSDYNVSPLWSPRVYNQNLRQCLIFEGAQKVK